MIGARERPDVAFELLQKFHFDELLVGGHKVAERHFQIGGLERGGIGKQADCERRRR